MADHPSDSMPTSIHDARRLPDLAGDQPQLLFRQSENVNLDVKNIVRAEFSENPPRDDIQILETRKNASEYRWVGVRLDPKAQEGRTLLRTHGTDSSYLPEHGVQLSPGFP
jgi:hypothetical protein